MNLLNFFLFITFIWYVLFCMDTIFIFRYLPVYLNTIIDDKLIDIFNPTSYKRIVWYLWAECDSWYF